MEKINIGCAYYPEMFDEKTIEADATMMNGCGISMVRICDFAWSHMEPSEGKYDFEWLHNIMRIMGKHGIGVIMSTPSSSAPPWLVKSHPEILKCSPSGVRAFVGIRDHTCYTSPVYRKYCEAITEKMCGELASYAHIIAWQIDNEIGHSSFGKCCCDECQKAYQSFLREKYSTMGNLNKAWGNTFWSRDFSAWDEIPLANQDISMDAAWVLDSQIFRSNVFVDHIQAQARIIRQHFPRVKISTNSICGLADRYKIYQNLDFAGIDHYPDLPQHGFARNCYYSDQWRNIKPGTMSWVTETDTAPGVPEQNRLRELLWNFIARGNSNIVCFHWRRHLSGQEKFYTGLLDFSGKPGIFYQNMQATIQEIAKVMSELPELPPPEVSVAILFDYENHWIYSQGCMNVFCNYENMNWQAHSILLDMGINSDVISPNIDFSKYKLLVIPVQPHITKELAGKIRKYVENGGTILMSGKSGLFDGNANFLPQNGPQHLQDVFGIEIRNGIQICSVPKANQNEPGSSVSNRDVCFSGKLNDKILLGIAGLWISEIEAKSAETLLKYENSIYAGMPFFTFKKYGKGNAFYFAADIPDYDSGTEIMRRAANAAGVAQLKIPKNVEIVRRGDILFLLNHSNSEVRISLSGNVENLLGNFCSGTTAIIPPFEIAVAKIND